MDEELKTLVRQWKPPEPGADLDERMLAAFRARMPRWRKWLRARVEVPVPVLAASVLLVVLAGVWAVATVRAEREPVIRWRPVEQPVLRVIPAAGGGR